MPKSRSDLIARYDIQEEGLKNLIEDLCSKPEDANNLTFVEKALRGYYSDYGSTTISPMHTDFKTAGYDDLLSKVNKYDHDFAAKAKPSDPDAVNLNRDNQNQRAEFSYLFSLDLTKTTGELFENSSEVLPPSQQLKM